MSILLALYATAGAAAIPASERVVLLNLYTGTNGGSWTTNTGWNGAPGTECTWHGVTCNDGGSTVTRVNLHDNHLTGSLPTITGLTNLRSFAASQNQLTGSIPALSGLTNLQAFSVWGNQLTGSIPAFSGLTNLQIFWANSNHLTGPIPMLGGLTNLREFSVWANQLSGPIPALSGLAYLTHFEAANNQLSGSIPVLTGLTSLQIFWTANNQLTGTIPALSGLTNLQAFSVWGNQLTGSLPVLTGLTSLQSFWTSSNQLTGSIPALTGLTNLQEFGVSGNQLAGSMPVLTGLTNLTEFAASQNRLTGSIPALTGLTNLQRFSVWGNELTGSLPALIGLTSLQTFSAGGNQLTNSIPPLTGLTNLQKFYVNDNQLTGSIPALTGLTNLQEFYVNGNRLTGSAPAVPSPSALKNYLSALCPNALIPTPDAAWDLATGDFPWYEDCTAGPSVPAAVNLNQHGLTGSWYESATSGQGFAVQIIPDQSPGNGLAFVSWFTFDTTIGGAERQRWYTLQGDVITGQPNASLTIYQNTGGNFNAPPATDAHAVGTATLSFATCSTGSLTYTFSDGSNRAGAIPLTRLLPNVTCSVTTPYPTDADFALSGSWYAGATTSGQGFMADVAPNANAFFLSWYTYMPTGANAGAAGQRWYTAQGAFPPGTRTIPVQIYETTGGLFDYPTPPGQNTVPVGNGTMTFQNCSAATFSYTFTGGSSMGSSATIALGRVGPVPPGCTS